MNETNKGQVAVEYLSTFMWSALALLALIGVLSYFGVFNIGQMQDLGCDSGTQIPCVDIMVSSEETYVMLRNDQSRPIRVTKAVLLIQDQEIEISPNEIIETGTSFHTRFQTTTPLVQGSNQKVDFCIYYITTTHREYKVCGGARVEVQPIPPEDIPTCRDGTFDESIEECDVVNEVDEGCTVRTHVCNTECRCVIRDDHDLPGEEDGGDEREPSGDGGMMG